MEIPIKLNVPEQTFIDPLGQALLDVTTTSTGVKQRLGSEAFKDLGTSSAITGIFDWKEQDLVIVVSGEKLFKISNTDNSSPVLEGTGESFLTTEAGDGFFLLEDIESLEDITGDLITNDNRAVFASYGDYLYIAFGGRIVELHPTASLVLEGGTTYTCIKNNVNIQPGITSGWADYWVAGGTTSTAWNQYTRYGSGTGDFLEDADAPIQTRWIGIADKYLLALEEGTQRMYFAVVGEPWNWDSDWVSAEFMPDDAVCLQVHNGDVWIGGKETLQNFDNDGVTPWVSSAYGAIKSGVLAPYSFLTDSDGNIYYIDDNRRFVKLNGRNAENVDTSINTFLDTVTIMEDAVADFVVLEGMRFYIIQFPTEQKTLAVNLDNKTWSTWSYKPTGYDLRWNINCLAFVTARNLLLGGDTSSGYVNKLVYSSNQDVGVDIQTTVRSPRMQTNVPVFVKDLEVGLSKVQTTDYSAITSSISVRWRDDGKAWSDYLTKEVNGQESDHVLHFRRIGTYRNNRQYEFDCTNLYPYAIRKVDQV